MNNCLIQVLDMVGNAIGVEGAHVILQSAVNNEVCQADIRISYEYSRDSEIQTLMNFMRDRRRIKTNVVGYLV